MLKHLETVQCKYSATQTEHANPHQERKLRRCGSWGFILEKDSIEISHTPEYTWPSNNRGLCSCMDLYVVLYEVVPLCRKTK